MPRFARPWLATVASAVLLAALAPAAHAFPQVDRSNPHTGTDRGVIRTATPLTGQTFVAQRTGYVTHVRLWLERYSGTTPLRVELRAFDGTAAGPVLGAPATVAQSTSGPIRLPVAAPVTAGSAYAIVVDGGAMPGDAIWRIGSFFADVFAGGSEIHLEGGVWTQGSVDLAFETLVEADDTTAPSTTVSAGDGSGGWLAAPVALDVRAADDSTGVAGTRCWIDPPARPATYADAGSVACPAALTGDGLRQVWVASVDAAGNAEVPRLVELRVGSAPAPAVVEVPGPVRTVEVPRPVRTVEVPGPVRVEPRTETRAVTTPAPPVKATTTATARLGSGRAVRVTVGCDTACAATVTVEVRVGRKVVLRLEPATTTVAAGRARTVTLTLTRAQRKRLAKTARVRASVRTEDAAAPSVALG